jgi:hypothetical protein
MRIPKENPLIGSSTVKVFSIRSATGNRKLASSQVYITQRRVCVPVGDIAVEWHWPLLSTNMRSHFKGSRSLKDLIIGPDRLDTEDRSTGEDQQQFMQQNARQTDLHHRSLPKPTESKLLS